MRSAVKMFLLAGIMWAAIYGTFVIASVATAQPQSTIPDDMRPMVMDETKHYIAVNPGHHWEDELTRLDVIDDFRSLGYMPCTVIGNGNSTDWVVFSKPGMEGC